MKKSSFLFVVAVGVLCFISLSHAGETVTGTVVDIKAPFVTIEDYKTDKQVTIHFDQQTKVEGKLEKGIDVEVQVNQGHAVSIEVLDEIIEE